MNNFPSSSCVKTSQPSLNGNMGFLEVKMKKHILIIFLLFTFTCSFANSEEKKTTPKAENKTEVSKTGQPKKKTAYKKFTELFNKAASKAEEELPKKIDAGMNVLIDNLEDFEDDIHAEPEKQSKFAKIFNYITDVDITENCNDFTKINPDDVEKVGAYTDSRK